MNAGWPTAEQIARVLLLQDYNTRVVCFGTMLLGVCAAVVGTFMLLRKRSLIGDVVGHSSLPGIASAFLILEILETGSGRSVPGLLVGAAVAGLVGVLATTTIDRFTRIRDDAALAIVLSVFYGLGIALFTVIQSLPTGNAAGLNHFILGWVALMTADDVRLFATVTLVTLAVCGLLFKEFSLLCFDEEYAAARGFPVVGLDLLLMGLVIGVTVIGLQSVGLLLVVALPILPAASARFWTDRLGRMTLIAAGIGGASAWLGVVLSALVPRVPAGPTIVLAGAAGFLVSLLFGTRRGIVHRWRAHRRTTREVGEHELLRAMYELGEDQASGWRHPPGPNASTGIAVSVDVLLRSRSWSPTRLRAILARARRTGLIDAEPSDRYRFTPAGAAEAARVVRNHRLWELYLIRYADVAPGHVDRDADLIEHVLEPELIAELERELPRSLTTAPVPQSPHALAHDR